MKTRAFVFLLCCLLPATGALAQTVPTAHEKAVGTNCANAAAALDFDTLVQCTSTSSTAGTMQKAPLFVGKVTTPPYASTACDASKAGMLQFTGTGFLACDGSAWFPFKLALPSGGAEILTRNDATRVFSSV